MTDLALVIALLLGQAPGPGAPAFVPLAGGAPARASGRATSVFIEKRAHRLAVLAGDEVLRSYTVAIGSGGLGPKRYEGDRTTPVGTYRIRGQFRGLFHRFLNVTYPNDDDRRRFAELKAKGEVPEGRGIGFGIGIHGVGSSELAGLHKKTDWTLGCIALDDDEVDELATMLPDGAPVTIVD